MKSIRRKSINVNIMFIQIKLIQKYYKIHINTHCIGFRNLFRIILIKRWRKRLRKVLMWITNFKFLWILGNNLSYWWNSIEIIDYLFFFIKNFYLCLSNSLFFNFSLVCENIHEVLLEEKFLGHMRKLLLQLTLKFSKIFW